MTGRYSKLINARRDYCFIIDHGPLKILPVSSCLIVEHFSLPFLGVSHVLQYLLPLTRHVPVNLPCFLSMVTILFPE